MSDQTTYPLKVSFQYDAVREDDCDPRALPPQPVSTLVIDASACKDEGDAILMSIPVMEKLKCVDAKIVYDGGSIMFRNTHESFFGVERGKLYRSHIAVDDTPYTDPATGKTFDLTVTGNARDIEHVSKDALRLSKVYGLTGQRQSLSFVFQNRVGIADPETGVVASPEGIVYYMETVPQKQPRTTGASTRSLTG